MKKWWLLGIAAVLVVAFIAFMAVRETRRMQADYEAYAGRYVATSSSYQAKPQDVLELSSDGTWTHSRGDRTIDEGGDPSDLPSQADLKDLNWLGPSGTADCLGSAENHCPQPTFAVRNDDLIYVPTTYRQTTNKGDWETGGNYYRVLEDGDVLVDEEGVRWERRS